MACQCRIAAGERQANSQAAFLEISHRDDRGEKSEVGPASGFPPSRFAALPALYFFL